MGAKFGLSHKEKDTDGEVQDPYCGKRVDDGLVYCGTGVIGAYQRFV